MNRISDSNESRAQVRTTWLHQELLLIERAADAYARARREVYDVSRSRWHLTDHQRYVLSSLARAEAELQQFRVRRMELAEYYADAG